MSRSGVEGPGGGWDLSFGVGWKHVCSYHQERATRFFAMKPPEVLNRSTPYTSLPKAMNPETLNPETPEP